MLQKSGVRIILHIERRMKMDEIDRKILSCLQNNGRISNKELAQRINLVPSAALKRLRRLEETGVISGYACRIDHGKIGLNMNVLISVTTVEKAGHIEIGSKLAELPDVLDVFDVAGNTSYIIRAVVKDTSGLNNLIIRLGNIPGVVRTQTTLIMNMIKNELAFNFNQDEPLM